MQTFYDLPKHESVLSDPVLVQVIALPKRCHVLDTTVMFAVSFGMGQSMGYSTSIERGEAV